MIKVLFVCVKNSARSQMAEAFLNQLGQPDFIAESAGIEKGTLNPIVVKVMAEIGYDISNNSVDSVFDFLKQGNQYSLVVKVCDQVNGQRCPVFPNVLKTLEWNVTDPATLQGSPDEIIEKTRQIRDEIKTRVTNLIAEYREYAQNRKD
ncbi:MAG: arsenate reductase ArsC [Erysipelotrichaceae bacterium]|nr:arsenate reductase ArsC [Erysipelotrichaceae bacterium]